MTERLPVVYLDTNVFVRAMESSISEAEPLKRLFRELRRFPGVAITSVLTWAELLAPTKREGALTIQQKEMLYSNLFFAQTFIPLAPVSLRLLKLTPWLRASRRQKIPDAIHIVTAYIAQCRYFMTFDDDAERLPYNLERLHPDENGVHAILATLNV